MDREESQPQGQSQENSQRQEPVLYEFDPRFNARIAFQEELRTMRPSQQGQFCDLCGEIVVQHKWAIVDGYGFIVIACSTIADNHLRLKDSPPFVLPKDNHLHLKGE
jgi:hypothetical protein